MNEILEHVQCTRYATGYISLNYIVYPRQAHTDRYYAIAISSAQGEMRHVFARRIQTYSALK